MVDVGGLSRRARLSRRIAVYRQLQPAVMRLCPPAWSLETSAPDEVDGARHCL